MTRAPSPHLPEPDGDALAHSALVVANLRQAIERAGGFITMADYLQRVLYAPGLGYYVAGARKFGAAGDFVTAAELTPLHARAVAVQVDAILRASGAREVVELGAGSGAFAADLLAALARRGATPSRYVIVELGPELRERQRALITERSPDLLDRVAWQDAPPAAIDGAVLVNEVLDAVPPHVVERRGGQYFECGVGWDGALREAMRPLSPGALRTLAEERFPPEGDYLSEINPAAEALVEELGRRITRGAMLLFDYGFPQREYYHPQRSRGTLMGHYRHRAHADPLLWPGLSDLTAHVDFTAIALAGERAGLEVAGYAQQAPFLIGCGILDLLKECGEPTSAAYLREAAAVQKLLSPAEMGELFKVIALARPADIDWPGFSVTDHRHRL